jgi:lipopolysaccharide export system protein LptA
MRYPFWAVIPPAIVSWLIASSLPLAAQAPGTDAFAGLGNNSKDPIQIEADRLEIMDKDKKAVFSGNVNVAQGDMTMRAQSVVVFYSGNATKSVAGEVVKSPPNEAKVPPNEAKAPSSEAKAGSRGDAARSGAGGAQQITRIEADGGITVKQKDQTATGEKAVYDAAQQTVRLMGNVVLSQGENVVRGDSLVVDLRTRSSRIESGGSKPGRVFFLGVPGSGKPDPAKPDRKKP